MDSVKHVLVFPAGSEIALEIHNALKWQKDMRLFGATSADDHSAFVYERLVSGLPYFDAQDFLSAFNKVIDDFKIDYIYPARDDVQLFLTQHQDAVHAKVVTSPLETVETCRSKILTYEALSGLDFVPRTYTSAQEVDEWPIFAKPSVGEGSRGVQLVEAAEEMEPLLAQGGYVFCEYLPGTAYTVDCYTDAAGTLQLCAPRTRDRVKAGIAVRSRVVRDEAIVSRVQRIGEQINSRLSFSGAWYFQLKERANGELVLLESSPRIAGTMGLTRNLGVNFPLLTIYQLMGMPVKLAAGSWDALLDKVFISRYKMDIEWDTLYIDYDDTLHLGDEVNCQAMSLVYQCRNQGKRVVLLSRHHGDLQAHMRSMVIAPELFDEVIHLTSDARKSDYVSEKRAIFVDDSFRERADVAGRRGIPTFDVSSIEALIDWRR